MYLVTIAHSTWNQTSEQEQYEISIQFSLFAIIPYSPVSRPYLIKSSSEHNYSCEVSVQDVICLRCARTITCFRPCLFPYRRQRYFRSVSKQTS